MPACCIGILQKRNISGILFVSGRFYGRDSVLTIREDSADDARKLVEVPRDVLYYRTGRAGAKREGV